MALHDRRDPDDCGLVVEPLWREECLFQYAERAAAAGELEPAFAACNRSLYGRECSFHLLRQAAEPTLDGSPAEAAPVLTPYLALEPAPDAPRLFWRTWFRDRLARHHPVDPTGCPDRACEQGAREAIYGSLTALARAQGAGFCLGPVSDPKLWVPGATADAWVAEWQASECRRRELAAPRP